MNLAETNPESKEVILCVDIDADELPPSIQGLMGDHAFVLVHCPSVYEALARIKTLKPVIALVRVDWLTSPEFEFFSICTRSYPELCIFVVGEDRCAAKINRAIQAGASARLSTEAVEGILAEHGDVGAIADPDSADVDVWGDFPTDAGGFDETQNNPDTFASPDNEFDAVGVEPVSGGPESIDWESDLADADFTKTDDTFDPGELGGIETSGVGTSPGGISIPEGISGHPPTDPSLELAEDGGEPSAHLDVDKASEGYESGGDFDRDPAEPSEESGFDDDSPDDCRPVIVPWSEASRGTTRTPPTRTGPTPPAASVDDAAGSQDAPRSDETEAMSDDPPLLSPEELSLLLGE
ncbi:MAG: hypothetical protein R3E58_15915 [Phycisphaerae bacterium]|nr:hypothetical protein [Phycisphaerales bacterium]